VNGLVRTGGELQRQLAARSLDADGLQNALPGLTMTARGGRGNFLYDMARLRGVDWRAFGANVSTVAEEPLRIDAEVVELVSGGLTVDTLDFYARHNGSMLDYAARLVNRPSTVTDLGLIRVSGSAWERSLTARVLQQNSGGETGFDFGVRASMVADTTIRVEMAQDPVLGYERWRVGERSAPSVAGSAVDPPLPSTSGGDWIEWDMNNVFRGDLHLTTSDSLSARHIAITSASLPGIPAGAIRLSAAGLDLERMLDLLPTAPEVGGVVSSDLTFGLHPDPRGGNIIAARGYLGAKDFSYDGDRLADIDADVDFGSDGSGRMALDASVELEGSTALTAKGTYEAGAVDFDVEIPAVPLALVEGLLPDGMATLEGTLDGRVRISGDPSRPVITGDAGFTDGAALMAMTGTRLGISPERIAIADSRVTLRDWGLVAPNGEKFSVNGSVNIADLSAPRADLVLRARNFQFVSSPHVDGSQIYGTALLDADITARGAFDAMSVRGEVDLAEATDIVYIVRDTGRQVKDERQHIVQFVRFADSLAVAQSEKLSTARRTSGMDVLVAVNIEEGLQATLSLDEANENRFELRGGGTLAFSANRQGDTRLTGRYTMSDGTLYYRPPLISQKIFAVADGSYIEWTGPAANPEMHLSATQTSNVRVESDSGPRDVAFEISVNIAGTLAGMGMTFDLAAPGDLAIQNQLLAMTPEAKMQQAVQLLAFNQYTAPGYTASGRAFDARNQLGDFVSREVNQWARNNLQGVDFSMDINTTGAGGDSRTDYSYSISKSLFSDRVKISIGGRVSDGEGARTGAGASHGFADNLLEDIILEYRLTRRDNFFLKLFRYNTRESILEGEVTETGGGFVFRKRMNGFRRKR
jgi:hypothetical protein